MVRPEEVLDFPTLYKANCAACHGENGRNGAAISLANPVYLAVAGEDKLREITGKGVAGKLMPPFAKSAGGMLTDQQINVLAHGMVQQWSKPDLFAGVSLPPYASTRRAMRREGRRLSARSVRGAMGRAARDQVVMRRAEGQGRFDRRWIVSGADQRSGIAQYYDRGSAG